MGQIVRKVRPLINLRAILAPKISYFPLSPVEPDKKLTGFEKNRALVVSDIRVMYYELFFSWGPSSRVGYLFQLYLYVTQED